MLSVTAKARTAAIAGVSALLAFANAASGTSVAPGAEGHATGCRSLMQAGADPDENQHQGHRLPAGRPDHG